jgi:hypothetical protein
MVASAGLRIGGSDVSGNLQRPEPVKELFFGVVNSGVDFDIPHST